MLYNVGGGWVNSQFPGSWMIRPVVNFTEALVSSIINNNELECKIYPNPFMESTTIYFSEFKQRTISIMDISGRKLKTINSFNMHVDIKVDDMKSGMYFIQIFDGENQSIKKIILK